LVFLPVTSAASTPTPLTTITTTTTTTTAASATTSKNTPKPTTTPTASTPKPTTTSAPSSSAATKTPAKQNNNNKSTATPGAKPLPQQAKTPQAQPPKTPQAKTPPATKTPNTAKSAAAEDDKPRLSKQQKKKLRAEENEKKEGAPSHSQKKGPIQLPSGLQYEDTLVGKGAVATKGNRLQMRYQGTLATGQIFDSNMPRGRPFSFKLGAGEVIRGWDEGLQGMRVGGKRTLKIPAALGYGSRGAGKIPPNANLTFEVELISKS